MKKKFSQTFDIVWTGGDVCFELKLIQLILQYKILEKWVTYTQIFIRVHFSLNSMINFLHSLDINMRNNLLTNQHDQMNMTKICVLDRKDHTKEHERWNLTEIV